MKEINFIQKIKINNFINFDSNQYTQIVKIHQTQNKSPKITQNSVTKLL